MAWAKTAFGDMTDAEVKAELRKHYDEHGNRLYEVDDEAAFERSIARDCEINTILYMQWKTNLAGLKRIGIDAAGYEKAGPTLYGLHEWEHPRRTRMVKRPDVDVIKHDARPPTLTRPCGTILAIK